MTSVGCRPSRLQRFGEGAAISTDELAARLRVLSAVLEHYLAACDPAFVEPACVELVGEIQRWSADYDRLGRWTTNVARSVIAADAIAAYVGRATTLDPEMVMVVSEADVLRAMRRRWTGQLDLGVPPPPFNLSGLDFGGIDQDGPPTWLEHLKRSGSVADLAAEVMKLYGKVMPESELALIATLRAVTSRSFLLEGGTIDASTAVASAEAASFANGAAKAERASRYLGQAGALLAFGAGFTGQWSHDDGRPLPDRLLRSSVRGLVTTVGGLAGAAGARVVGGVTGTAACASNPVSAAAAPGCGAVAGFVLAVPGAYVGADVANKLADRWIPFMHDEPVRPGKVDADGLRSAIRHPSSDKRANVVRIATVKLAASDLLRLDPTVDPTRKPYLADVLPERNRLVTVIYPPVPMTPTGTIPSATPAPSPPVGE